jgi:hypothetical protein
VSIATPLERCAGARYSTSAEMRAFVHALCACAPGRARLETAPASDLPVLIWTPPRGAPALRVMLVGSLHGASEAAPGEALLALARDLLCGPQAGLADGLELIVIPCPNPAGRDRDSARNAAGVNLNRDFVLLGQTATRALDAALRHYAPDVLLDAHESAALKRQTLGQEGWLTAFGAQWDIPAGPAAAPPLRALAADVLLPALLAGVRARGLDAQRYVGEIRSTAQPITHGHLTLRALRNKAAMHGAASVLLETPMEPKADPHPSFRSILARVARQGLCMQVFLETVRAHAPAIRAARAAVRALADAPTLALGSRYVREPADAALTLPLRERSSGALAPTVFADHRALTEDPPRHCPARTGSALTRRSSPTGWTAMASRTSACAHRARWTPRGRRTAHSTPPAASRVLRGIAVGARCRPDRCTCRSPARSGGSPRCCSSHARPPACSAMRPMRHWCGRARRSFCCAQPEANAAPDRQGPRRASAPVRAGRVRRRARLQVREAQRGHAVEQVLHQHGGLPAQPRLCRQRVGS